MGADTFEKKTAMQKLLTLLLFLTCSFRMSANVFTVSNNINSPGQYTNPQLACDAAQAGDTILIHASPTMYGDINVIKKLTLIGEGTMPQQQFTIASSINTINLGTDGFTDASGSRIMGLNINNLNLGDNANSTDAINGVPIGVDSISVTRCRIDNMAVFNSFAILNLEITNNIIRLCFWFGPSSYNHNVSIKNNIIDLLSLTGVNNLVKNNIISSSIGVSNSVVSDNIFYSASGLQFAGSYNMYSNNLFYSGTPVVPGDLTNSNNTLGGNLFQQNPLFVLPKDFITVASYSFNTTGSNFANFHLQTNSPGRNYGTDGTDIGIYGGSHPWVDAVNTDSPFRYYAMPNAVPFVTQMNIVNASVPVNGTLNVNFNAKVQP